MKNGNYRIVITSGMVSFYTENFFREQRSFIHTALMNREVSSIFTSSFITGILMAIYSLSAELEVLQIGGFILVFTLLFILLRSTIFKERVLRVDFMEEKESIKLTHPGIIRKRVEEFGINEVKSLSVSRLIRDMGNPDAVEFVKKISHQHGTYLDISEREESYLLGIDIKDGSRRVIYVDKNMNSINNLLRELERFSVLIRGKVIYA